MGMGFPLMADGQTGVFYPPTMLLFMSLPAHWAVNLSILFHLWWAGLGAVWMGRKLGMESHGALLTGVAFGFSGFMAAHTGYLGMQNAIAWLPWAIGALVAGRWAVGGLCLALMLVAGHPQIAADALRAAPSAGISARSRKSAPENAERAGCRREYSEPQAVRSPSRRSGRRRASSARGPQAVAARARSLCSLR